MIPVFYTDSQVHEPDSFSKSPFKPKLLLPLIDQEGGFKFMDPCMIGSISDDRLKLVHDPRFVDDVFACKRPDGFGKSNQESVRAIRYTVGNFVLAAEWAAAVSGNPIVWSLTSGFHHACYFSAGAFCTFNALMLSAFELRKFHGTRTLIVDEDAHFGNGCTDIIKHLEMDHYCRYMQSIHTHSGNYRLDLEAYGRALRRLIKTFKPTLIMYQAGADNWCKDPLGGSMTKEELFERDLITFRAAREANIPVVCNLAGGYAENFDDTLGIHMATGRAMKEAYS